MSWSTVDRANQFFTGLKQASMIRGFYFPGGVSFAKRVGHRPGVQQDLKEIADVDVHVVAAQESPESIMQRVIAHFRDITFRRASIANTNHAILLSNVMDVTVFSSLDTDHPLRAFKQCVRTTTPHDFPFLPEDMLVFDSFMMLAIGLNELSHAPSIPPVTGIRLHPRVIKIAKYVSRLLTLCGEACMPLLNSHRDELTRIDRETADDKLERGRRLLEWWQSSRHVIHTMVVGQVMPCVRAKSIDMKCLSKDILSGYGVVRAASLLQFMMAGGTGWQSHSGGTESEEEEQEEGNGEEEWEEEPSSQAIEQIDIEGLLSNEDIDPESIASAAWAHVMIEHALDSHKDNFDEMFEKGVTQDDALAESARIDAVYGGRALPAHTIASIAMAAVCVGISLMTSL